jgi:hypothetical protein
MIKMKMIRKYKMMLLILLMMIKIRSLIEMVKERKRLLAPNLIMIKSKLETTGAK